MKSILLKTLHRILAGDVIDLQKTKDRKDFKEFMNRHYDEWSKELAQLNEYRKKGKIGDHDIVRFKIQDSVDGEPYYSINVIVDGRNYHWQHVVDDNWGWAIISDDEEQPMYGRAQDFQFINRDWANLDKALDEISRKVR